jgi:hypothetical protein
LSVACFDVLMVSKNNDEEEEEKERNNDMKPIRYF